jgi:hypothetical protein
MSRLFAFMVAAATLAAACAFTAPARAAATATCGEGTYSYAGIGSRTPASGVSATIAPTAVPSVRDGHVDGWVGLGGPGMGPNGADEWIQVGLTSVPNQTLNTIYYEVVRPGHGDVTRELSHDVSVGQAHKFQVLEVAGRPNWWRVWLDGAPASAPIFLPASHGKWPAQAIGESWAGMSSGACNAYGYAFSNVRSASVRTDAWSPFQQIQRFQDVHYQLVRSSPSSFVARSVTATRIPAATP